MSITLKIVSDVDTLDLQDGVGLILDTDGWVPSVGASPTERVTETLTLTTECTSTACLQNEVQKLARLASAAQRYLDSGERSAPVWLVAQLDGETQPRRSLVTGLRWAWLSSVDSPEVASHQPSLRLSVERVAAWEEVDDDPVATSYTATGNVLVAVANTGTGSREKGLLRRVVRAEFSVDSPDPSDTVGQLGVALVSSAYTAEQLTLDLKGVGDGTTETCGSAFVCVGGDWVRVGTNATPGSVVAITKNKPDVPPGRYLVFIRARLDLILSLAPAGALYDPPRVTVLAAPYRDASAVVQDSRAIVVGSPTLAAGRNTAVVGVLTVPPAPDPLGSVVPVLTFYVRFDSAGGGSYELLLDALALLPLDGGALVVLDDAKLPPSGAEAAERLHVQTTPLGRVSASSLRMYNADGDEAQALLMTAEAGRGWGEPAGYGAQAIVVGSFVAYDAGAGTHDVADVVLSLARVDRYQALSEV